MNVSSPVMRTSIAYLYRDASNYKNWNQVTVDGKLSDAQIETILSCCEPTAFDSDYWFIPSLVGLPEERFEDSPTEDDFPFFEINRNSFKDCNTYPTVSLTPTELVQAFLSAKGIWKEHETDYLAEGQREEYI